MNSAPPVSEKHSPRQNLLLAALPAVDYDRLLPDLEVYEADGKLGYVSFPTTSIVSMLYVMENGASAEIAVTGNDGLVGIALFMGGETTPSRAIVQSAGYGYRLRAAVLKRESSSLPGWNSSRRPTAPRRLLRARSPRRSRPAARCHATMRKTPAHCRATALDECRQRVSPERRA